MSDATVPIGPEALARLAEQLFGAPNRAMSGAICTRFGRRGSLAVRPAEGVFYDHERGEGGGVLDMLVLAGVATDRSMAARWLEQWMGHPLLGDNPPLPRTRSTKSDAAQMAKKIDVAFNLWSRATPIAGSLADTYLRRGRCIHASLLDASIRFLGAAPHMPYNAGGRRLPAMISAVVNSNGSFIGAHITYLSRTGLAKAETKPNRKVVGLARGGHIPLVPGTRLVIGEGVESALSAWEAAQLCSEASDLGAIAGLSAVGLANFDWAPGTVELVIAPDQDASGAGEDAALRLARRADAAGLGVSFLRPPAGWKDWNDHAKARAIQ